MKCLCLLTLVYLAGPAFSAHGGESSSTVSATTTSVPSAPPCAMSHERLYVVLRELLIDGLDLYVNCLSFGRDSSLVSGVISGVNRTNSSVGGERLELRCVEGAITGRPSLLSVSMVNMTSTACLTCMIDTDQESQICQSPCQSPCERCFNMSTTCSRCLACQAEPNQCLLMGEGSTGLTNCQSECRETLEVEHERFNACECPSGYYRELNNPLPAPQAVAEEEGHTACDFFPELEDYRCVKKCDPGKNNSESLNTCFACGLDYCLMCDFRTNYCEQCLRETVLFEHRCYACPFATVAIEALEQEHELEEEKEEARDRQIELAVTLPILCVGVALFFILMSVFAHYRYPHLNPKGHKRHRVKPEDFAQSLDVLSEDEPSVWRSRPTVRLR